MLEVVIYTEHYSRESAVTYVCGSEGRIATFPYNPSSVDSIVNDRLLAFAEFIRVRQIHVIEVLAGSELVQV